MCRKIQVAYGPVDYYPHVEDTGISSVLSDSTNLRNFFKVQIKIRRYHFGELTPGMIESTQ